MGFRPLREIFRCWAERAAVCVTDCTVDKWLRLIDLVLEY